MVTDRYSGAHGVQPVSLAAALALSAAMVSGLVLSSPAFQRRADKVFKAINIPVARPDPEPMPTTKPLVRTLATPTPRPKPIDTSVKVARETGPFTVPHEIGTDAGTGTVPIVLPPQPTPTPAPVLVAPSVDPRFARDLQPIYPAVEERAGRAGLVTVRVLVGADGRVEQVERVAAASDAFFAATERQALGKWRFRPATRDGVPVAAWRTMTVRFELPE